jgi:hypothetical protein
MNTGEKAGLEKSGSKRKRVNGDGLCEPAIRFGTMADIELKFISGRPVLF